MSQALESSVKFCEEAKKILLSLAGKRIPKIEADKIQVELSKVIKALHENKQKIWIRTKGGRELSQKIQESSLRTLEKLNAMKEEKDTLTGKNQLKNLFDEIKNLQTNTENMVNEISKRTLVAT